MFCIPSLKFHYFYIKKNCMLHKMYAIAVTSHIHKFDFPDQSFHIKIKYLFTSSFSFPYCIFHSTSPSILPLVSINFVMICLSIAYYNSLSCWFSLIPSYLSEFLFISSAARSSLLENYTGVGSQVVYVEASVLPVRLRSFQQVVKYMYMSKLSNIILIESTGRENTF